MRQSGVTYCYKTVEIFAGTVLGLGGVAFLAEMIDYPLLIAPFGASAVLIYYAKSSPLAQPKNLVFGHLLSAMIAITCCRLLGNHLFVAVLAVGMAITCMMLADIAHPPGGATALLCVLQNTTSYSFLGYLFLGVMILLLSAIVTSKLVPYASAYPYVKTL